MRIQDIESAITTELLRQKDVDHAIKVVVDRLVDEASQELHAFVGTVKMYLDRLKDDAKQKGTIVDYDDHVLELQSIKLPVLMYFAADFMEDWGLYSDVAKAEYQEAYDKAAQEVGEQEGRVVDMEIAGRQAAQVQDWAQKVKQRVYSKLKTRLKYADEVFNGLRKVMSKRITDLEVFRKEQAKRMGRDYEGDHDANE